MKEVGQENSWREATASFSEAAVIDIDCEIPSNRTCEEPIVDVVKNNNKAILQRTTDTTRRPVPYRLLKSKKQRVDLGLGQKYCKRSRPFPEAVIIGWEIPGNGSCGVPTVGVTKKQ